jgi:predicted lipoprotein
LRLCVFALISSSVGYTLDFVRRLILLLLIASLYAAGARAALTAATVVTVSAASFETTSVAPDAIVAAFGRNSPHKLRRRMTPMQSPLVCSFQSSSAGPVLK